MELTKSNYGHVMTPAMPANYIGQCSLCDYESPLVRGDYGALVVDKPTVTLNAHPDDKRIVILVYPFGDEILKEHGFAHSSAVLAGRFLYIKQVFCKSCGHVYETRQLGSDFFVFGCMPPILTAIVVGIVVGIIQSSIGQGLLAALLALFLSGILIDWLIGVCVRIRYADRAREFRIPRGCPKCEGRRIARGGTIVCPKCRQQSMKIKVVGRS